MLPPDEVSDRHAASDLRIVRGALTVALLLAAVLVLLVVAGRSGHGPTAAASAMGDSGLASRWATLALPILLAGLLWFTLAFAAVMRRPGRIEGKRRQLFVLLGVVPSGTLVVLGVLGLGVSILTA